MKNFINVKDIVAHIKKKKVINWLDKLTFPRIFLLWIFIIVSFGFIYYFFQNGTSYLMYALRGEHVNQIKDAIYFSFITATTAGLGDISPVGLFKWIAVFEIVFDLLFLAVITSKLISIKQDIILNELYESSVSEKVNRLRSSLLLFRQNLHRIISKIEDGTIKKREVDNIYIHLSSFEDTMNETLNLITKPDDRHLAKDIGPINTGLIFNSVLSSFETLNEMITVMTQHNMEWKRDINLSFIEQCLIANDKLFEKLNLSKDIMKQTLNDLNEHKNEVTNLVKNQLIIKELGKK